MWSEKRQNYIRFNEIYGVGNLQYYSMVCSFNDKFNTVVKGRRRGGKCWEFTYTADKGWSVKQHGKGIYHPPCKL